MTQYGGIEALKNGQKYTDEMRNSYLTRRNFVVRQLHEMDWIGLSFARRGLLRISINSSNWAFIRHIGK